MKPKIILIFMIVILIISSLTGCIQESSNVKNTIDNKDDEVDYVIVENGQVVLPLTPFNTLNPLMTNNLSYYYFSKLIFDGLFELDEKLEPVPNLVDSYNISDSGNSITLKLRDDIYWHDGEKFTSKDVFFTINVLNYGKDETAYGTMPSSAMGAFYDANKNNSLTASIIDDYNIEIKTGNGFSNFLEILTFPIIPEHEFVIGKGNNYSSALKLEDYVPIGTGPFKFIKYDKNKSVHLGANERYWKGKPDIDNVVGKIFADESLFITAYEAGQLNITPDFNADWDKYTQNGRSKIMEYISSDYEFLGFNFSKEIFNNENGDDLRKAIAYGIDRQEIIRKIYLGHATQTDVPINPNSFLFADESNYYGYNKELSKKFLETLGYMDKNEDGIVEDAEGKNLTLRLITNPVNEYRLRVAELIREDLKEVGIEIILDFDTEIYDHGEMTEEIAEAQCEQLNNRIYNGDFDIVLLGWQISTIPELSFMFHSSQQNLNNFIKYNNPDMDSMLEKAFNSYNKEDKLSNYMELQEFIIKELPYVSLYYRNNALIIDSNIKGELSPTFFDLYNGLEKCLIVNEIE